MASTIEPDITLAELVIDTPLQEELRRQVREGGRR